MAVQPLTFIGYALGGSAILVIALVLLLLWTDRQHRRDNDARR